MRDKKGNFIEPGSAKLYKSNILAVAKRYTPPQENLNFLVTETDKVIDFLNTFKISTQKAYYNAIVSFLSIAKPTELKTQAYEKYLNWLKHLGTASKTYKEEDYLGYTWKTLKPKLEQIIKKERDPVLKLLLALFTYVPPRRSQDYSFMKINEPNTGAYNVLIFNDNEKKFIFNKYKNA